MNENKTYLSSDLRIEGNIECASDIEIHGEVIGNIICQNNVMLSGRVQGDIAGRDITVGSGRHEINLNSTGSVVIGQDTQFHGNIVADSVQIFGTCIGDVSVNNRIVVGSAAYIQGNVKASNISIQLGAVIEGHLSTKI